VRTLRTECLDHVLVYGRRHLEHVLGIYVEHYIQERPTEGWAWLRLEVCPPRSAEVRNEAP
jgi:hypothetical protein